MRIYSLLAAALLLAASLPGYATVFATVHGVVHDPQHRPIAGAKITLQAAGSDFVLQATTGSDGTFELPQAPIGVYRLTVTAQGFAPVTQSLSVASGTNPILHIPLSIGTATQSVVVNGSASSSDSVTPATLITRAMIDQTPGAGRTIGMEMITDYVPGAYMTHDMLHMRGGHQTSWLIDGIAIPNTKIASNVGPQIDPKDIDALETQRGSYSPDVGDRTYGVFNVLPRNGFERNREGELLISAGNLYTGEMQISLGDHSERTAWYTSFTGARSDYGLATPVTGIYHDATNSESGFLSLIRNQTPQDQLRLDAQYRQDYFDVHCSLPRPGCGEPLPRAHANDPAAGIVPSRTIMRRLICRFAVLNAALQQRRHIAVHPVPDRTRKTAAILQENRRYAPARPPAVRCR